MAGRTQKAQGLLCEISNPNLKVLLGVKNTVVSKRLSSKVNAFCCTACCCCAEFILYSSGCLLKKRVEKHNTVFGTVTIKLYLREGRRSTTVAWLLLVNVFLFNGYNFVATLFLNN